jgi:cystathionine beta-lyase
MATFDFDTVPERRGTDSQKWQKYAGRDILPMWVADMDFKSPPPVLAALQERVAQGIFGYARPVKATVDAVVGAMEARYGWKIDPAWLVWLPGLVCGLNVAVDTFSEPGDEILCLTPVYPPFLTSPRNRGRTTRAVPLVLRPGEPASWGIDWDLLQQAITPRSKVLLLCQPHNPLARIWGPDEVAQLAEFCVRHKLILCSDEIHCDLILDGRRRHSPTAVTAAAVQGVSRQLVTFMAPSKTYNLPGLGTSFAIVSDPELRLRLVRGGTGIVAEVTALGFAACEAAYRDGEPWRQALLAYLSGNRDFLLDFVRRELPGIRVDGPIEATYLAWLNVSALGLSNPAAHFETHGVGLSDGEMFGAAKGNAVRLNFGCPRATLAEGLRRMKAALAPGSLQRL